MRSLTIIFLVFCVGSFSLLCEGISAEDSVGGKVKKTKICLGSFMDTDTGKTGSLCYPDGVSNEFLRVVLIELISNLLEEGYEVVREVGDDCKVAIDMQIGARQDKIVRCHGRLKFIDFLTVGVTYIGERLLPPFKSRREQVCRAVKEREEIKATIYYRLGNSTKPVIKDFHKRKARRIRKDVSTGSVLSRKFSAAVVSSLNKILSQ